MAVKKITTPLTDEVVRDLKAGDAVEITGVIYQARDAAHKKLVALIEAGEPLPFELRGAVVYYMGPSPAKPGNPIGSAGPTTSGRMDAYAPLLMKHGLKGMIGKGLRTAEVKQAMVDETAVYFAATGGAGALLAQRITGNEVIAYPELGAEAVARLEVADFPAIVVNDCHGGDLYEEGRKKYAREA
jgi:fumarate hydratase subunit beta